MTKKDTKISKKKGKQTHPPVEIMITSAIRALDHKRGSSLHAIKNYIVANYGIDLDTIKSHILSAESKRIIVRTKGSGASGKFKLPDKVQKKSTKTEKNIASQKSAKDQKKQKNATKSSSKKSAKTDKSSSGKKAVKEGRVKKTDVKKPATPQRIASAISDAKGGKRKKSQIANGAPKLKKNR